MGNVQVAMEYTYWDSIRNMNYIGTYNGNGFLTPKSSNKWLLEVKNFSINDVSGMNFIYDYGTSPAVLKDGTLKYQDDANTAIVTIRNVKALYSDRTLLNEKVTASNTYVNKGRDTSAPEGGYAGGL